MGKREGESEREIKYKLWMYSNGGLNNRDSPLLFIILPPLSFSPPPLSLSLSLSIIFLLPPSSFSASLFFVCVCVCVIFNPEVNDLCINQEQEVMSRVGKGETSQLLNIVSQLLITFEHINHGINVTGRT